MPHRPQTATFTLKADDPTHIGPGVTAYTCSVDWDVEAQQFRAYDNAGGPPVFDDVASLAALKQFQARVEAGSIPA